MTPEAQRIALAEFEGYSYNAPNKSWPNPYWTEPIGKQLLTLSELPDYLNDLNSVHELEKRLDDVHFAVFRNELLDIIVGVGSPNPQWANSALPSSSLAISAEATQRCEALLKTLGLWKE